MMPSLRESPGDWLAMAALLALSSPLAIGLAGLSGVGHRWVDFLAQLVSPALVATSIFFILLLVVRLWPAAIAAGLVTTLLLVAVQPQWSPPRGQPRPGAPAMSVYFANTHLKNTNAPAVAASIRASTADVAILIEMSPELVADLPALLPDFPHVRASSDPMGKQEGVMIASRWPLDSFIAARTDVFASAAVVHSPLGPVRLVATHLTRPWPDQFQWGQIKQVMGLTAFVDGLSPGPTVIAGDFNSVSSARIGRQVQTTLGVVPAPGWPGTWPGGLPTGLGVTIDQIYRTPDLALLDRRIGAANGSDHWPVITRLTLAEPG